MVYTARYDSPLGEMRMAADEVGLCGLWFVGQAHFSPGIAAREADLPVFGEARRWLEIYFAGEEPDFIPPLHLCGTEFRRAVWEMLRSIPYGETVSYGALAARLACASAQAIGGAVGHNPISIIVPCHRVIGADGNLTGYAGGLGRKAALLALERRK